MIRFALCALLGLLAHPVVAADTLGALLDIPLGASFVRLERDLDFRDISASLAHFLFNYVRAQAPAVSGCVEPRTFAAE